MNEFTRYEYCEDNDWIYELGEHDYYYPIVYVVSAEKNCYTCIKAKVKLDYMKENQLALYIDLVENDKLAEHIQDYLLKLEMKTESIFSKMEIQDEMGRLLAEEMARDNLM